MVLNVLTATIHLKEEKVKFLYHAANATIKKVVRNLLERTPFMINVSVVMKTWGQHPLIALCVISFKHHVRYARIDSKY